MGRIAGANTPRTIGTTRHIASTLPGREADPLPNGRVTFVGRISISDRQDQHRVMESKGLPGAVGNIVEADVAMGTAARVVEDT